MSKKTILISLIFGTLILIVGFIINSNSTKVSGDHATKFNNDPLAERNSNE